METNKIPPTKIKNVFSDKTFRVNTPQFIKEACENCNGGMYAVCWNIFRNLLFLVAERATELNDPVLSALMLKLHLYKVDIRDTQKIINELGKIYNEQINIK